MGIHAVNVKMSGDGTDGDNKCVVLIRLLFANNHFAVGVDRYHAVMDNLYVLIILENMLKCDDRLGRCSACCGGVESRMVKEERFV
ncbi:hypothetical protein D3C86_2062510 [compost metagenome]